jgi:hypothetical protein
MASKSLLRILFILLGFNSTYGQVNLVSNPSFEDTLACPSINANINNALGWFSCLASPDHYHSCSSNEATSIPGNAFGYQFPSSGNAYGALLTFYSTVLNGREFMGAPLLSPLVVGQKYFVSFKYSLALNLNLANITNSATNNMGAMFSVMPYSMTSSAPINNSPQVYSNLVNTDTSGWTLLFGSFIADSAYQYIILGNFFDDFHTVAIPMTMDMDSIAYYFIDDVCVSTDSLFATQYTYYAGLNNHLDDNLIRIYPNPASDLVAVQMPSLTKQDYNVELFDMTGKLVQKTTLYEGSAIAYFDLRTVYAGEYVIVLSNSDGRVTKKLVVKK